MLVSGSESLYMLYCTGLVCLVCILANIERADPWTGRQKSLDFSRNPWTHTPPNLNMHVYNKSRGVTSKIHERRQQNFAPNHHLLLLCLTTFFSW